MQLFPEARPFLPLDLPLLHRLAPRGISFDSVTSLTQGEHAVEAAVWSAVPLADLGRPTFVLRDGQHEFVGQIRHKGGERHAHVTFIAPDLDLAGETAWLTLLDSMTQAAGRRGAQALNAEVAESGHAFVLLRQAGFTVHARQEIWQRMPGTLPTADAGLLRAETERDIWEINCLFASVIPRPVLQSDAVPEPGHGGLVYEQRGQLLAYVSITEGRRGIYVQPVIHPEVACQADAILAAALSQMQRSEKLPVYVPVRRYQEWLQHPLDTLGFEPWATQALMVRRTTVRVEHGIARPAYALDGAMVVPSRVAKCTQIDGYGAVNGISHNRRSRKTQSGLTRVPGRLA
ncbi:MAG TPA: hypothetical protein VKQ72_22925 [Aggregatilineales bacterium]|nr:hypothetical protein [Aggregatilineales bacterium]